MFPLRHGETVTRIRRQMVLDPYSEEETLGSWEDAAELPIEGVAIGPSSTIELNTEDRQQVITSMSLYGAQGLDVLPSDRIRARSGLWDVVGEEQVWANPFTGWDPGSEYQIRKVAG
jgi:hypothetical protein